MVQLMCIKAKTFIAQRILGRNNFIYLPCKDTRQLNIIFWVHMIYLQFIVTTAINIQPLFSPLEIHNMNLQFKTIDNGQEISDLLYVYLYL